MGTALAGVSVMNLGLDGLARAQSALRSTGANGAMGVSSAPNTPSAATFDTIDQIDAGPLNVGYAQAGPKDGPVVILLHGWPYDIHSFVDVAPFLASTGYRVVVPYLPVTARRASCRTARRATASRRSSPPPSSR